MKAKLFFGLILISFSAFLINCNKDDATPVKKYLLTKLKTTDSNYQIFTYDNANKLTKIIAHDSGYTFTCNYTYNASGVLTGLATSVNSYPLNTIALEMNSSKNPVKATILPDSITITFEYTGNKLTKLNYYDGVVVSDPQKYGYKVITYDANGNVTREVFYDDPSTIRFQYDYTFDTKKSPFSVDELKWQYYILMEAFGGENISYYLSPNNIAKNTTTIPLPVHVINYTYVYNADGYPTSYNDGSDNYTLEYTVK